MSPELIYFIKINTALIVFYAFYRLFFYKDTFFNLRRFLLLGFFILAFIYPVMNMHDWITKQEPIAEVISMYSAFIPDTITETEATHSSTWKEWTILLFKGTYLAGILLLCLRFVMQFGSIVWLKINACKKRIKNTEIHVPAKPAGPFSFFNWIFINPENHQEDELEEILTHERTHARQWHSIDVIIGEVICIFCWVNPFVWLLKREVRHNLEYLADDTVLESGYDSKSYQYHLLGLAHHESLGNIYNSFNVLHLKNRISMMNKKRTNSFVRAKYLLFIPITCLLLLTSNIESVARITRELAENVKTGFEIEEIPLLSETLINNNRPLLAGTDLIHSDRYYIPANTPPLSTSPSENVREEIIVTASKPEESTREIFTVVEEMPQFEGGDGELLKFINRSVRYPVQAQEQGIQGRVVATFTVNKDGSISDVIVVRGIDPSLDGEAIRVISNMPKWKPGKQRGQEVAVKYTLPIVFRLA